MRPLTARQFELLEYLRSCESCPSYDEITVALGVKGKSGVHRLIVALEERGYLKRIPNRTRCLQLLPDPELPSTRTPLAEISTAALAAEARRRGLVLCSMNPQPIEPLAANWRPGDVAQRNLPDAFLPLAIT